ncbi:MAG TPA: 4-hydroxy-tetrahydrodipicolinate reductase [Herpetosiphonaceae bacterium]
MTIRVCVAGATGWAGSALARGIAQTDDLRLVAAVSRTHAGRLLSDALGEPRLDCPVFATAAEALAQPCDVFVEYTKPAYAQANVLAALAAGAHVVIGTSGLDDDAYAEIDAAAQRAGRGVLAAGNFALTVVLLQKFAEIAARYIPHSEIIDYASAGKIDAPSGTARELAHRLGQVREASLDVPLDATIGERGTRGARLAGQQVHSVRLPGYVISVEAIFGMPDQKLVLRHEAGSSAQPYVDGALLAIRKVGGFTGLRRGLDHVLDLD